MKESFSFQSMMDNLTIYVDKYVPENSCGVIVQIAHGMAEHKERYERFATHLMNQGYIVVINDHRGHGQSINNDIVLGYFAKENGLNHAVSDMHQLTAIMKVQYPNHKYVLMGHSMGSMLTRKYLVEFSYELDGVILCGTAGGNPLGGIGHEVARMVALTKGDKHRSKFVDKLAFGTYNSKFSEPSKFAWLSRDFDEVKKYEEDELCGFTFTTNGFMNLTELVSYINKWNHFTNINKRIKMFIFSGDKDPVGDYGKGVTEVYNEFKKLNLNQVDLKLYREGRHEMLNEINREEVFNDVLNWLDTNIKS